MSEPLGDAGATIGKGSSTSLERTSGSDRSEKTGNESSTGDTLPAVTGRPNAYDPTPRLRMSILAFFVRPPLEQIGTGWQGLAQDLLDPAERQAAGSTGESPQVLAQRVVLGQCGSPRRRQDSPSLTRRPHTAPRRPAINRCPGHQFRHRTVRRRRGVQLSGMGRSRSGVLETYGASEERADIAAESS